MAAFDFNEADATTLETIDSKWEGDSGILCCNGSGLLRVNNAGGGTPRQARFENGQPATQSAQVVLTAVGSIWRCPIVQASAANPYGYNIRTDGTNTFDVRRVDTFLASASPGGVDLSANVYTLKIKFRSADNHVLVWIALGDVADAETSGTQIIDYTDATPLSGGYPGLRIGTTVTNVGYVNKWTDFVSAPRRRRMALLGIGR